MYYCDNCYCHVVNVIPRYRIKVKVMDKTDNTVFICDKDEYAILGKSCSEILDSIQMNEGHLGFPVEFEEHLIEKTFMFKIGVKTSVSSNFEPSFKVKRICKDETIISKFRNTNPSYVAAEPDMTIGLSLDDTFFSFRVWRCSICYGKGICDPVI